MPYAPKPISVGFSEEPFVSGTHMCYLFGDDSERFDVLARFFAAGRRAHERMIVLTDAETPAVMSAALAQRGVVAGDDLESLSARDYYFDGDQFLEASMLGRVGGFYEEALARGYSGARGSGDMSWSLDILDDDEKLLRYEASLGDVVSRYPTTCLCQYDVRRFSGATMMDVLRVHPFTLVRGQLIKNPYFVEPARFLERYSAPRS
jgi:DcmR-like sensory protein